MLGPSGSGKTKKLRAIAGFNTPSEGDIIINGKNITNLPVEKREIGMVFQSYALFPTMTVFDNIAYGLKVDKMPKENIENRVKELAQMVELTDQQLSRNVSDLSGGQQQRVAISRALAKKPAIVLFDEPLSNLDAKLRKQLRAELKDIQLKTGMTAIYVTHDQEEALELSDRISVFNQGVIEQIGTPEEIYNTPSTEFVCNFIGSANKLNPQFMALVSQNSDQVYSSNQVYYLREEKIIINENLVDDEYLSFRGVVERKQFYGTTTTIFVRVEDTVLKTFIKNDMGQQFDELDEVMIQIRPSDILSYEVK